MLASLLAALALATTGQNPAPHDTTQRVRIVRELPPVTVTGDRLSDPGSVETVRSLAASALVRLPLDRLADAVALQPGVVATAEDLHVRGGRAGELAVSTLGVPLGDPLRGRALELPLLAVAQADLLVGGIDADRAGSLAGELDVQTLAPTAQAAWLARWQGDGRRYGGYDDAQASWTGPLARTGLGLAAAAEARLDDQGLPTARTVNPTRVLGSAFDWRHDNHLLGWLELAPLERPRSRSLQVIASRRVVAPYDPMFTADGWVTFRDIQPGDTGPFVRFTPAPVDSASIRYRAGDHVVMTDERRLAVIASAAGGTRTPVRGTLAWLHASELTSVGLRGSDDGLGGANAPVFGDYNDAALDPFHAIFGDEPFFRRSGSDRWLGRLDAVAAPARGQRLRVGVGANVDDVWLHELDVAGPLVPGVDSLRDWHGRGTGGFAYAQHRWEAGGLVWNAGLRLQYFDAGAAALGRHAVWSWSPRLGFAYPVSTHDMFSLAYDRIFEDPARELLYENRATGYDRTPLGNGALEPAEVLSWQAALKHVFDPQWSLQFAVFARDVYGEVGARNVPAAYGYFQLQYLNADDAHTSGFEASLVRTLPRGQRLEAAYTFAEAWGSESNAAGVAYGPAYGERPLPTGTHPLDWDVRHTLVLQAQLAVGAHAWLAWSTRLASGLPWTPLVRDPYWDGTWPPPYSDLGDVNSRRLPWSEASNLTLHWSPPLLRGARVLLAVTNVFDHVDARLVSIGGWPNPIINTQYDEYAAYRTETGHGGGAYWDDRDGNGVAEWNPVHDPRLDAPRRAIRLGIELGH